MCRSVGWQPGECSEAPNSCPQWSSLACATSGLSSADRADGRRLCDPSGTGAAGVVHGPDAAETEPRHANPEASGFGSSGDPPGAGVQVHVLTVISSHSKASGLVLDLTSWLLKCIQDSKLELFLTVFLTCCPNFSLLRCISVKYTWWSVRCFVYTQSLLSMLASTWTTQV